MDPASRIPHTVRVAPQGKLIQKSPYSIVAQHPATECVVVNRIIEASSCRPSERMRKRKMVRMNAYGSSSFK